MDLVDLEFDFWFCAVGHGGLRGGFWVDFGGVWLAMGCGVAHGGFMGWLAMVVPILGFGCGFFFFF